MIFSRKILALFTAAALGTGLAACQQDAEDKSASGQGAMDQAPKQGYTGPASPSTSQPSSPGSAAQPSDSQSGSPDSASPSASQPQPGSQPRDQQQQQR